MTQIPLIWMPVIVAGAVAALGVVVYFIATRDRSAKPPRVAREDAKPTATSHTAP